MEKLTLEKVQVYQKRADELERKNGNRVEILFSPSAKQFTLLELVGSDYTVNSGDNIRIPHRLNYWDFETAQERKADLLQRTKTIIAAINGD